MNNKHYIGLSAKSVTLGATLPPVSGIRLQGENDAEFMAGDESGYVIEAYVPSATQQMALDMLQQTKGFVYQGYTANTAYIPPSAELGDGISVKGAYSILANREFSFTPKMTESIGAPYETEEDHEYAYEGEYRKDLNKRVKLGQLYYGTRITRKNGLEIVKTDGNVEKSRVILNSDLLAFYGDDGREALYYDPRKGVFSITQYADIEGALDGSEAFSQLSFTADQLVVDMQDAKGNISSLQQYVDSITLDVSNGSTSSTISLRAGEITIASEQISMSGLVTFSGLADGTTTIDGSCIKTGQISADRINLTGYISFGDLDADTQDTINAANSWQYGNTTYIDGSMIMTGTVVADILRGGNLTISTAEGVIVGRINAGIESSSQYGERNFISFRAGEYGDGAGIECVGNIWEDDHYDAVTVWVEGRLAPTPLNDTHWDLGVDNAPWGQLWTEVDPIVTSDLNKKKDVDYDLSVYDKFFDTLKPTRYRMRNGKSGRYHVGLISQDVENALKNTNLTGQDFAGFIKYPNKDGGFGYSLRYGEFIGLCVDQIQRLKLRITKLEEGVFSGGA